MKIVTTAALTIAMLGSTIVASSALAWSEKGPERMHSRLVQKLNLSTEQQTELQQLFEEQRDEHQQLDQPLSPDQRRAERTEMQTRIRALLTPEQAEAFDQMRTEHAQRKGESGRKQKEGCRESKG